MSTTTTNYGFIKPELTDAADITAMNENWDKLDSELSDIKDGCEFNGEVIVHDNFHVRRDFESVEYRSYLRPLNYALGGDYTTGIIHYINGANDSQLMFNRTGVMLRDNVNAKAMQLFGQHNPDVAVSSLRSRLYTYGTTDLTAGESKLDTGKVHFVYE